MPDAAEVGVRGDEMAERQPIASKLDDSLFSPYILRDEKLSSINEIIRSFLGSNARLSFYLTCTDKITREYQCVADVRKYENPKDRQIEALWIYGSSEDLDRRVSIRLSKLQLSNISISLEGPGMVVANCREKIEEWRKALEPWYSRLASMHFVLILLLAIYLLPLTCVIIWQSFTSNLLQVRIVFTPVIVLMCFVSGFLGSASVSILFWMQSWLFPTGVFAIGQGAEREKRLAAGRVLILGTIGISLIVGFVASMLASYAFQAVNPTP